MRLNSQGQFMSGRLPDFLGLGVQKGGTTTLHRLLDRHPSVFLPPVKEVHYFSLHFSQGEAWYRSQFAAAGPNQHCGEITPYYLFHPEVPRRVHDLLPEARLIVLLRDPVERALSQYFHSRRLGFEPLPLEQALAVESSRLQSAADALEAVDGKHRSHQEHSYLSRSRYEQQIAAWEALYPAAQFLVLRSEDLFLEPADTWIRVLEFLKLSSCSLPDLASPANAGKGESASVSDDVRGHLRQMLQPTYVWAAERFGLEWN